MTTINGVKFTEQEERVARALHAHWFASHKPEEKLVDGITVITEYETPPFDSLPPDHLIFGLGQARAAIETMEKK